MVRKRVPITNDPLEMDAYLRQVEERITTQAENPNVINSVQYGTVTIATSDTTGDATIVSVDWTKTLLVMMGWSSTDSAMAANNDVPRIAPVDATHVRATRNGSSATISLTVSFAVLAFK